MSGFARLKEGARQAGCYTPLRLSERRKLPLKVDVFFSFQGGHHSGRHCLGNVLVLISRFGEMVYFFLVSQELSLQVGLVCSSILGRLPDSNVRLTPPPESRTFALRKRD
jgi:hypothetical protein